MVMDASRVLNKYEGTTVLMMIDEMCRTKGVPVHLPNMVIMLI